MTMREIKKRVEAVEGRVASPKVLEELRKRIEKEQPNHPGMDGVIFGNPQYGSQI